MIMMTFSEAYW